MHPSRHSLAHKLLEGGSKSAIAAEAALLSQLLGGKGTVGGYGFSVKADKVLNAQAVDVGIISRILMRKVVAEIIAVGTDSLAEVVELDVVPQIELRCLAFLLQQTADVGGNSGQRRYRWHSGGFIRILRLG